MLKYHNFCIPIGKHLNKFFVDYSVKLWVVCSVDSEVTLTN